MELRNVLSICHTLESILVDTFGVTGLKTMIISSIGQVIVTSDGSTILGALNLYHPLAKLIIKSANEIARCHGGGYKTFILYLTGAIETLDKLCQMDSHFSENRAELRLKMAHSLNHLMHGHLSCEFEKALIQQSLCNLPKFENWQELYNNIIYTELSCTIPSTQVRHFTKILNSFLMKGASGQRDYFDNLLVFRRYYTELCVKMNNLPFTDSKLVESILLQGEFSIYKDRELSESPVRFIVLHSNLHEDQDWDKYNIEVNSNKVLGDYLNRKRGKVDGFVKVCKHYGVNLIFCTERVLESFLHMCGVNDISVIEHVNEDDANRLTRICKVSPMKDFMDIEGNVCEASSCRSVSFGGVKFIQITVTERDQGIFATQLLVCSLGNSQCEEVYQALYKCVKIAAQVNYYCCNHKSESSVEIISTGQFTIPDKGNPPASEDKGYPPANEDKGYPPASEDKGYPPASEDKGDPPASEDKGDPPAREDKGDPPSSEDKGDPPASEDKGDPPASEDKSDPHVIQDNGDPCTIPDKGYPPDSEDKSDPHVIQDNGDPCTIPDKGNAPAIGDPPASEDHIEPNISKASLNQPEYAWVIQAGGTFELFVEHYVTNLRAKSHDIHDKMACEVIAGAVSKVPQCLLRNSNKQSQKLLLEKRKQLLEHISVNWHGVNGCTGVVEGLPQSLEPIPMKVNVLLKALSLISQILRLDSLVSVPSR